MDSKKIILLASGLALVYAITKGDNTIRQISLQQQTILNNAGIVIAANGKHYKVEDINKQTSTQLSAYEAQRAINTKNQLSTTVQLAINQIERSNI